MAADKPELIRHVVMSVPHSGTRTLMSYLSENRPEVVPAHRDLIGHWHFNFHADEIAKFFLLATSKDDRRRAYIPVRNPYDVCDSWERRYRDAPDKGFEDIRNAIRLMVEVIDRHPEHIEIFKMEDLPVIRGYGPMPEGWDRDRTRDTPRFLGLRRWIQRTLEVEAFYRTYYNAEELWWL